MLALPRLKGDENNRWLFAGPERGRCHDGTKKQQSEGDDKGDRRKIDAHVIDLLLLFVRNKTCEASGSVAAISK